MQLGPFTCTAGGTIKTYKQRRSRDKLGAVLAPMKSSIWLLLFLFSIFGYAPRSTFLCPPLPPSNSAFLGPINGSLHHSLGVVLCVLQTLSSMLPLLPAPSCSGPKLSCATPPWLLLFMVVSLRLQWPALFCSG
uniref:Uncharacterized protein n=1 Tax=Dunaliella tertiolecta TaxID=3047 RepID=A0A7S3QYZ5_DUNTE